MTLRDALRVIGRWKWLILAFLVLTTAAAAVFSVSRTPQYTSAVQLKYEKQVDISNPLGDTGRLSSDQINLELQSVASTMGSAEIKGRVAGVLGMDAGDPQLDVTTEVIANTSVVRVEAAHTNPSRATRIANAFAAQFIESNKEIERERLQQAESVIKTKLKAYDNPATHTSADYILLQQRLRDLQIAEATVTGNYRVIAAATPPSSPSSPKPLRDAGLGLAVGVFGGIGLAFLLEQLNTRPRSHREVAEVLGMPVVGRVPRLSKNTLKSGPLVAMHDPESSIAESLRVLRSNLDFLTLDQKVSTVLVTSPMQGEGKSLTVCNLAVTLAMGGRKVVVIDADLRRPMLHKYLGLQNTVGLSSVIAGRTPLFEALQRCTLPILSWSPNGDGTAPEPGQADLEARASADRAPRLYVLTAGPLPPNPGELISSQRFEAILAKLLSNSIIDFVLIDTPAFLPVGDAAALATKVDGMFVLVNMQSITRPLLAEVRDFLAPLPCRKLGIIAVYEEVKRGDYYRYHYDKRGEKKQGESKRVRGRKRGA